MKINVGVFFGGKSVEHEVSVITAVEAMNAMDTNKYNIIPIYITKEGEFYTGKNMMDIKSFKNIPELLDKSTNINISINEKEHSIINNESGLFFKKVIDKIDVAFPIMHGTNGEDGTIQGLFELMNIPYVGSNIVASANGMDKITMKMILKETGLPVVPYLWFFSNTYFDEKDTILKSIDNSLGFPVIVKPANLGSSVGIQTAKNIHELEEAIDTATSFSNKIIVESLVENLREINVSVLGDYSEAYVSVCEEPLRTGTILSYEDKYAVGSKTGGSKSSMANAYHKMPAELPEELAAKIKAYAKMTFIALNCSGVARIDFLLDSKTNEVYVNEINTIPGSLSYYFWEMAGMSFRGLLDKLIELAVKKHKEKNKLIFTNNINILSISGKGPKLKHNEEVKEEKKAKEKKTTKTLKEIKEEFDIKDENIIFDMTNDEETTLMQYEDDIMNIANEFAEDADFDEKVLDEESKIEENLDDETNEEKVGSKISNSTSIDVRIMDDENGDDQKVVEVKEKSNTFKAMKSKVLEEFENPDAFNNSDLKIKGIKSKKDKKEKKEKLTNVEKTAKEAAIDELFSPDNK